jgi:FAD/FMN-containing dehydrogenase
MTVKLTGEVVRTGDDGYEAARVGWNRLYSRYPDAIVFCSDTEDVVNAVKWPRGGHRPARPQRAPQS